MAFENKYMSVINYANGWTMWHYDAQKETDPDAPKQDDFFTPLKTLGATGDLIVVCSSKGTYLRQLELTKDGVVRTKPITE